MKSLPNTFRLIVLDPPSTFKGVAVEPRVETKKETLSGVRNTSGDIWFEVHYDGRESSPTGSSIKQDGQGRFNVSVGWYGESPKPLRRLRVFLDLVPNMVSDCEATVLGSMPDGHPHLVQRALWTHGTPRTTFHRFSHDASSLHAESSSSIRPFDGMDDLEARLEVERDSFPAVDGALVLECDLRLAGDNSLGPVECAH